MKKISDTASTMPETPLSRRAFLGAAGGVTAAASIAAAGLPASALAQTPTGATTEELPDAEPIAPVDPPAQWDAEADFVVVGTGGGGLNATMLALDNGASVITVEKMGTVGGATAGATSFMLACGGAKLQDEQQYAMPDWPFDVNKFMRTYAYAWQYSFNDSMVRYVLSSAGPCADWMMDDHGVEFKVVGPRLIPQAIADGEYAMVCGQTLVTNKMYDEAVTAGADFHLSCPCTGLVWDGQRVIGIKASENGTDVFFKANRAVVLCSGGIGMNFDLLKKYLPTAYESAVCGGPIPSHTGDCTRMALGLGADMDGFDSWSCWESMPDNDTRDWNFFWGGEVQLCRNPWLRIDKTGKRCSFISTKAREDTGTLVGQGDAANVATEMSRIGHREYEIFDANFAENVFKITGGGDRCPLTPEDNLVPGIAATNDWLADVDEAIAEGRIKKADTLEDLAAQLGLDADVVLKAVENWNALCEAGADSEDELLYPYDPTWLIPIKDAPFYGAKVGGSIGKTLCGLRVTPQLQVANKDGEGIPGLYANFTTAGGMVGQSSYSAGIFNVTPLGAAALSWISGYAAMQSALQEESA